MLVLSRKEDESILLGENIVVKIISIDRGSVKIGFEAPSDCIILREELKMAVENENKKVSVDVSLDVLKELESKIKLKR
jgi:carbon storage regulator